MNWLFKAIKAINENAEFKFDEQDIDSIEWLNGTTPIAKSDLERILEKSAGEICSLIMLYLLIIFSI